MPPGMRSEARFAVGARTTTMAIPGRGYRPGGNAVGMARSGGPIVMVPGRHSGTGGFRMKTVGVGALTPQ